MTSYTLTIVDKRIEVLDTVTLVFKQPGLKKITYMAGQFLTLIFKINGRRYLRPYSFSSAPGIDKFLEVTVKRVPGGVVSNHICDIVTVGDVVEVLPPMGDFIVPKDANYQQYGIVLWGVGSGITPLFSIAKQILQQGDISQKVTLLYGNRTNDDVIFKTQIDNLHQQYPDRFEVWHFLTQVGNAEPARHLYKGRIEPNFVLTTLSTSCNLLQTLHYICGPSGLKLGLASPVIDGTVPSLLALLNT